MANKISLANKYRPQGFDAVVEQDSIKTILFVLWFSWYWKNY